MKANLFQVLDIVTLQEDLPSYHLHKGDLGTIVHVYPAEGFYEVEFLQRDGRTIAVVTLPQASLGLPGKPHHAIPTRR